MFDTTWWYCSILLDGMWFDRNRLNRKNFYIKTRNVIKLIQNDLDHYINCVNELLED